MWDGFPAGWTEEGIVYAPFRLSALDRFRLDPLDTVRPDAIVLRWGEAFSLRLGPRFPNAWLEVQGQTLPLEHNPVLHGPRRGFGDRVAELLDLVERRDPTKVEDRGWAAFPDLEWEEVGAMPEPLSNEAVGAGAFRSAPRPNEDPAVAMRRAEGSLATLLRWLVSHPDRPFRAEPRDVRLTETHVYVERRDGARGRLPRSSIRRRDRTSTGDRVYTFGRSTELLLLDLRRCDVVAGLEADLAAR